MAPDLWRRCRRYARIPDYHRVAISPTILNLWAVKAETGDRNLSCSLYLRFVGHLIVRFRLIRVGSGEENAKAISEMLEKLISAESNSGSGK